MEGILEKIAIFCTFIVFIRVFRTLFNLFYGYVVGPSLNLGIDVKKAGKWAVITGGTDGVGKAYAEQLASKGLDIVLISRTKERLETVAQEIRDNYKVNTKIIDVDFSEGSNIYSRIEKELYGIEVGVLVNNVGVSYPHPDYFLELKGKEKIYHDIIQCNVIAVLAMCQIVMPGMVERRKGVVINISSATGEIPSPLLAVYGASKVFVSKLSEDLYREYKDRGITVQCILPGFVATKMSKIQKASLWVPSPKTYVSSALKTLGVQAHSSGYLPHILLPTMFNFVRNYISDDIASWLVFNQMKTVRAAALRKAQRAASN